MQTDMSQQEPNNKSISVGRLAKRWGIGTERVQAMIRSGLIPGAFSMPSCGRFGQTIRIPLARIYEVEARWRLSPQETKLRQKSPQRQSEGGGSSSHFPELMSEHDAECLSDDRD